MSALLNFLSFTDEGLIKLVSVISGRVLTCIDWGVHDNSSSRVSGSDLIVPIAHNANVDVVLQLLFSLALPMVPVLPAEGVTVLHVMPVLSLGSILRRNLTN